MPARAWTAALALAAGVAGSGCALLPNGAPPGSAPVAGPMLPPPLELQVDAPAPLKRLLDTHLDLARLARAGAAEALDAGESARLIAAAPAQARELLQTEGYFEPEVRIARDAGPPLRVRLQVTPGPRAEVTRVTVTHQGALAAQLAAGDAPARRLAQALEGAGPLRRGLPFRNADWSDTKQQWLARLRAAGYARAAIASSAARVDAPARAVELDATLDSGPLFRAGMLHVEGLVHHDEATVRHLAGFGAGAPLIEARLLDYQERLQSSGLFDAAAVTFEPDPEQADATPLAVRVREQPLQQAVVGLGYSANTGPRASLEHSHRRLLGWPLTSHNRLEWGRDAQSWSGDFYSHPKQGFARDLLGVQIERLESDVDIVLSQRVRLGRTIDTPAAERLYFGEWLRSRQAYPDGTLVDARAASANLHLVLRRLDSALLPTRGYALSLQFGAGQATSTAGASGPFARSYARFTGYWPLGAQWYGSARVEAGAVVRREGVVTPDALGFRAGGDESVRGYGYRSLAPTKDGRTVSGDVLLTGSVELARPLSAQTPAVWGAVFVDAGRAATRWVDYTPALGWGVGVRWRSPIGPLRADLAWGQELRRARLHLSVGISY